MLDLHTYITALFKMGLSQGTLAANFDVSSGTINNWINDKTKTRYRVPMEKLLRGTKGCLEETKQEQDEFVQNLINNMEISVRESTFLHGAYSQKGYAKFIPYILQLAVEQAEFVPTTYGYDPQSLLRPVIGVGQNHALAAMKNGHVRATGANDDQQCNTHSWRDIVSVVGCWKGSIGLRADGVCVATGLNVIEDGSLFRWTDIAAISTGSFHVLGLKADGTVLSFGRNPFGQCDVSHWQNVKDIAAGSNHSVALLENGTVIATGKNDYGQCDVKSWKNIRQISAASDHTVGLLNDGTIVTTGKFDDFHLKTWKNIKAIATGEFHVIGLTKDGCVLNTGSDICGLSDVERWHNIIAIAAGCSTSIGIRADGRVFVTHDKHKSVYLNTDDWILFENKEAKKDISDFDSTLVKYKQKLFTIKKQALKVSPYITEYHDNIKLLDFSNFQAEYERLEALSNDMFSFYKPAKSMPTLENIGSIFLTAFIDFKDTIDKKDGRYHITQKTYEPFMNFLFILDQLELDVRLIEQGISFPDLVEQQMSDFAQITRQIPTWD